VKRWQGEEWVGGWTWISIREGGRVWKREERGRIGERRVGESRKLKREERREKREERREKREERREKREERREKREERREKREERREL